MPEGISVGGLNISLGADLKNLKFGLDQAEKWVGDFKNKNKLIQIKAAFETSGLKELGTYFKNINSSIRSIQNDWSRLVETSNTAIGSMSKFVGMFRSMSTTERAENRVERLAKKWAILNEQMGIAQKIQAAGGIEKGLPLSEFGISDKAVKKLSKIGAQSFSPDLLFRDISKMEKLADKLKGALPEISEDIRSKYKIFTTTGKDFSLDQVMALINDLRGRIMESTGGNIEELKRKVLEFGLELKKAFTASRRDQRQAFKEESESIQEAGKRRVDWITKVRAENARLTQDIKVGLNAESNQAKIIQNIKALREANVGLTKQEAALLAKELADIDSGRKAREKYAAIQRKLIDQERELLGELRTGVNTEEVRANLIKNLEQQKKLSGGALPADKQQMLGVQTDTQYTNRLAKAKNENVIREEALKRIQGLRIEEARLRKEMELGIRVKENTVSLTRNLNFQLANGAQFTKEQTREVVKLNKEQEKQARLGSSFLGPGRMTDRLLWFAQLRVLWGLYRTVGDQVRDLAEFHTQLARAMRTARSEIKTLTEVSEKYAKAMAQVRTTHGVTWQQAGEALYQLGSAGLSAEESIEALNSVLTVAVGTEGDIGETTKMIAGIWNNFTKSVDDARTAEEKFNEIGEVLVQTWNKHQAEMDDIVSSFKYIGPIAKAVGLDFKEVSAMVGVLADHMIRGSRGGTTLVNILSRISSEPERFRKLFGLTEEEYDPTKPLNFVKMMETLNKRLKTGQLTIAEMGALFQRFNLRAAAPFITLIRYWNEVKDSMEDYFKKLEGASDVEKRRLANISDQWKRFYNNLGSLFARAMKAPMDFVTSTLYDINEKIRKGSVFQAAYEAKKEYYDTGFPLAAALERKEELPTERLEALRGEYIKLGELYTLLARGERELPKGTTATKGIEGLPFFSENDIKVTNEVKDRMKIIADYFKEIKEAVPEIRTGLDTEKITDVKEYLNLLERGLDIDQKGLETAIDKYTTQRQILQNEKEARKAILESFHIDIERAKINRQQAEEQIVDNENRELAQEVVKRNWESEKKAAYNKLKREMKSLAIAKAQRLETIGTEKVELERAKIAERIARAEKLGLPPEEVINLRMKEIQTQIRGYNVREAAIRQSKVVEESMEKELFDIAQGRVNAYSDLNLLQMDLMNLGREFSDQRIMRIRNLEKEKEILLSTSNYEKDMLDIERKRYEYFRDIVSSAGEGLGITEKELKALILHNQILDEQKKIRERQEKAEISQHEFSLKGFNIEKNRVFLENKRELTEEEITKFELDQIENQRQLLEELQKIEKPLEEQRKLTEDILQKDNERLEAAKRLYLAQHPFEAALRDVKDEYEDINKLSREWLSQALTGGIEGIGGILTDVTGGNQSQRQQIIDLEGELKNLTRERDVLQSKGLLTVDDTDRLREINDEMSDLNSQVKDLKDPLKQLGERFRTLFKDLIDGIREAIAKWIAFKIVMGIVSAGRWALGGASTGGGATAVEQMYGTNIPEYHARGGILPNIVAFRRFSSGGITNNPTLAMLGDNPSKKELVIPFENIQSNSVSGYTRGEEKQPITIVNLLTEKDVAMAMTGEMGSRVILNHIDMAKRKNSPTVRSVNI